MILSEDFDTAMIIINAPEESEETSAAKRKRVFSAAIQALKMDEIM